MTLLNLCCVFRIICTMLLLLKAILATQLAMQGSKGALGKYEMLLSNQNQGTIASDHL